MNKLIDFGKKAMFYVRVLSGYEERRIRSYRLDLEKRIIEAEKKKAEIRKIPEQLILSEVRQMVEEMKAVNKQLEDTEAAINEYFSPVDKQAEMIVEMQLKEEEKTMKQMMQAMKAQALLDQEEAHKNANLKITETKKETTDNDSTHISKAQTGWRWFHEASTTNIISEHGMFSIKTIGYSPFDGNIYMLDRKFHIRLSVFADFSKDSKGSPFATSALLLFL